MKNIFGVKSFGLNDLLNLSSDAKLTKRQRKNLNLHDSFSDKIQYFVNTLYESSYIQPHMHYKTSGDEILVSLEGLAATIFFNEKGKIKYINFLEPISGKNKKSSTILRIPPMVWHTVIPLTKKITLLEIKSGPFKPNKAKIFADWAPPEDDSPAVMNYFLYLKEKSLEMKDL